MDTTIIVSDVLRESWKNVKSQIWILAGLVIGLCLISFTVSLFMTPLSSSLGGKVVSSLISYIISSVFALGYIKNMFQTMDGDEPQFSAYMQHPAKLFSYMIAGILSSVLVCIGLFIFVIPGVYLYLRLQFFGQFIVDENASALDALRKSWYLTKGRVMPLLGLLLAQLLILIVGVILFIIGVFVAYPLVIMSQCYVYRLMNKPVLEDME